MPNIDRGHRNEFPREPALQGVVLGRFHEEAVRHGILWEEEHHSKSSSSRAQMIAETSPDAQLARQAL